MTETIDLINALASGKTSDANNTFNDLMSSKISAALDAKKIELANDVYNGVTDSIEQEIGTDEVQGTETEINPE
jgi:acetylglutamate kinase